MGGAAGLGVPAGTGATFGRRVVRMNVTVDERSID